MEEVTPFPNRFAVYRKDMQIFEILRPYGAPIMKFVYEDPLGVPLWHVVGTGVAPHTHTLSVSSRSVEWTYTGAALVNPEGTINIPIVQFNKNAHIPNTIRGVRVLYMDKAFGPAYFSKKIAVTKAVAAAEPDPSPINYAHPQQRRWYPEDEDTDVKSKGLTLISMIIFFLFVSMYSNYMDQQMKNKMNFLEDEVCYDNPWSDPFVNADGFPTSHLE